MWDLEYLLLFGVPNNKWELWDGRVRWAFPFCDGEIAEAHFAAWTDTLRRLRDGAPATVRETPTAGGSTKRVRAVRRIELSLYPRPIDLRMPMSMEVFETLHRSFWRRDLWPGQAAGKDTGFEWSQTHYDLQLNLWKLFREFCREFGGVHCGRVAIALDDRNAVEPDQHYFQVPRAECMRSGITARLACWHSARRKKPRCGSSISSRTSAGGNRSR